MVQLLTLVALVASLLAPPRPTTTPSRVAVSCFGPGGLPGVVDKPRHDAEPFERRAEPSRGGGSGPPPPTGLPTHDGWQALIPRALAPVVTVTLIAWTFPRETPRDPYDARPAIRRHRPRPTRADVVPPPA